MSANNPASPAPTAAPSVSSKRPTIKRALQALAGLLITLLLLGSTLWVVRNGLERSVIDATDQANASITQAFINENWARVRELLPRGEGWQPGEVRASRENAEIDSLVRTFSRGTDVLKIKIYNLTGRVLYSSDPSQIGDDASANRYFQAAVKGGATSQLTFRGRFDGMEGHLFDRDLISSYIPVRIDGLIAGVVELYADRTFAVAQAHRALLSVVTILAPLFLGAYLLIMVLLIRHERLRDEKQKQLHELAQREEQASRAKTEFLAHMSHELRTPLNAILGHAQLLDGEFGSGSTSVGERVAVHEHVDRIMGAGWHLLGLIEEVLDLTKIESGATELELAPVALPSLLEHCVEQLKGMATESEVRLDHASLEPDACWVSADPVKLRQILLNLTSNAIKYNLPGGSVTIAVRAAAPDTIAIEVSDTGRGMNAEQLSRLFQPFTRFVGRDEVIQGSGIGLALSKRLTEAMNGTLSVTSEQGVGSVFTLFLPRSQAPGPETHKPPAEAPAGTTAERDGNDGPGVPPPPRRPEQAGEKPLRVLYIEDAITNLEVVRMYLEKQGGFEMLAAEDGEQGLMVAREARPDVILLDMNLPGIDGMAVKERLADDPRTADIPVVALSAGALKGDIDAALAVGFTDYLTKPLRLPRLVETLDRLSRSNAPSSPA